MLIGHSLAWPDFSVVISDLFVWYYLIVAFLIGSIPFGLIFSLLLGVDVRKQGSGNIGATNVVRVLGKKVGAVTFLADFGKGWLVVILGSLFFAQYTVAVPLLGGVFAVLGHTKSAFLKFKGGKGVATSLGVLLALDGRLFLAAAASWLIVFTITRISGLSAIITFLLLPASVYLYYGFSPELIVLGLLCVYVIVLHRQNIQGLLKSF